MNWHLFGVAVCSYSVVAGGYNNKANNLYVGCEGCYVDGKNTPTPFLFCIYFEIRYASVGGGWTNMASG